jgi:hypothetical protein
MVSMATPEKRERREPMEWIRRKLTYANTTATLALFGALGGTGYAAVSLPRDSVGAEQLRARSVGSSELRSRAVTSRAIRNRSVRLTDISTSARNALRGQQGPQGPAGAPAMTLRAAVSSGGGAAAGNARSVEHLSGSNEYRIDFGRDLAGCIYSATLAAVQSGPTLEQPEAGRITVGTEGSRVVVRTFAANGSAAEQPFHINASC